jgi:hypothetical protein
MAEAVLRLGHADRQLVKAHGREALQVGRTTAPAGVGKQRQQQQQAQLLHTLTLQLQLKSMLLC